MTARIWKQTLTGRRFPLASFTAADIDLFGDVAEALARICRYGGHVPGNPYSVAQHCVIGCDAAFAATGDDRLAAHLLLHDAHEAYFGDMTTPVAHWLGAIHAEHGGGPAAIADVIRIAKDRLDAAIWAAAGLAPPSTYEARAVKLYDLRLLRTERDHLLSDPPCPWDEATEAAEPLRLRGRLIAWPVGKAAEEYRSRLVRYCPNARRM